MKKIMFNDKYGLTDAVLNGNKTMTRRVATWETVKEPDTGFLTDQPEAGTFVLCDRFRIVAKSTYKIGEVVAVAQSYETMANSGYLDIMMKTSSTFKKEYCGAGWNNKMFVRADLMPHQIRITNIKVERLQDISEEDCLKEGIQEYFPYIDRDPNDKVRTFRYFKNGKIRHCISPASKCFAYFIDDVSGKGTWERNPFVFAYTFELIK